ncbi:puromycin sensitive aminopeptidase [Echinococcus multilocularis]|uniref:Puromycin sensitive aminopeptidase n=1 Tax=Echinococcus multilocularis TaxID=6211 RepID=A0A0S4MLY1_ECHMU|nr:puromycin sensitive aminopeptidase [Echinococcus multilocularis]
MCVQLLLPLSHPLLSPLPTSAFELSSTDFSNDHLLRRSIIISVLGGIGHGNVISTAQTAFKRWYAAATPAPIGEAEVEQAKLPA